MALQTGVGKSTLINRAFGVKKAVKPSIRRSDISLLLTNFPQVSAHYRPGEANIETPLISPENTLFVLHDSQGFEPGEDTNYETAKRFILSRRSGALGDRLHAVWFCLECPRTGTRLLESAAEDFLKSKKATLGTIPLIIVFTKYDEFVDDLEMKMLDHNFEEEELMAIASSKAESILNEHYTRSIHPLAGESLPHVAVSTEEGYENTLPKLVQLTYSMVSKWVAHEPSVVSNMAQRVNPTLKIQGTIDIGKKKYWTALRSSPNFAGHTVWDCLYVIHTDIVRVWNFPTPHLLTKKFRELMVKMVEDLHVPKTLNLTSMLGGSPVTAVSAVLSIPAAPIVIPIVAGLVLGSWAYSVYRQSKVVQQRFIAFIVDLTHVMETLFIITAGRHERVGSRAIKLAYNAYNNSAVKAWVHNQIESYRELEGRDAALEMIEYLIKSTDSEDNGNYHAEIRKLVLDPVNLSQDEPW
ncbi:hypothetical protein EDD16DRAFT_1473345 [Pisolithus croceorrhizus]|nr:hypothetical protein EDD16DRAFT_1473345 [Pisolithus croceorrhizus]KAI6163278.1 hypothetical protein EDD17DRAFT_1477369 [Pisolithus thermaeus]